MRPFFLSGHHGVSGPAPALCPPSKAAGRRLGRGFPTEHPATKRVALGKTGARRPRRGLGPSSVSQSSLRLNHGWARFNPLQLNSVPVINLAAHPLNHCSGRNWVASARLHGECVSAKPFDGVRWAACSLEGCHDKFRIGVARSLQRNRHVARGSASRSQKRRP